MAKRLKRAFTITELVIVIAVVAILAAVLIPTFSNIIKKADESADTQLVKNLNTILSSEQTVSQEAAPTMSDAIAQAQEGGYTVDKLTPTSDGDILWEQDSNRFVLVSGGEILFKDSATTADIATEPYKFWKITNEDGEIKNNAAGYSYYLGNKYSGGSSLDVTAGLDVGEQAIEKITYATEKEQTVVFNTTGGTLEIDAPKSDVKHYGSAKMVDVKEVRGQSYHLYGTITDTLKVTAGHIYIEAPGAVNVLDGTAVTEESGKATATIDMSSSATVGTVVIAKDVAEAALGTALKGAVEGGAVDTVEKMPEEASLFAGGIGTEKSPFLIETAEQFAKIAELDAQMKEGKGYCFELRANIDLRKIAISDTKISENFCGYLDGNGYNLTANDTLEYIFMDATGDALFMDLNYTLVSKNIMLCSGMTPGYNNNVSFNNVDIYSVSSDSIELGQNIGLFTTFTGFSNVKDSWCDSPARNTLTITNCDVFVNISGTSYNAVFIGGGLNNTDALVKDCSYNGNYYGEYVSLVNGNNCSDSGDAWANLYGKSYLVIENVINKGGLYGTERIPLFAAATGSTDASEHTTITNCDIGVARRLTDDSLNIEVRQDGAIEITAATQETEYYVLTFVGGTRRVSPTTENSSYRFSLKLEVEFVNNKFNSGYKDGKMATVEQYLEMVDENAVFDEENVINLYDEEGTKLWVIENEGTVYYVFDFENEYSHFVDGNKDSSIVNINSAQVTAYDNAGLPIAQKTIQLS